MSAPRDTVSPSRAFLMQQATLNAVWREYPNMLKAESGCASRVLIRLRADLPTAIPGNLIVAITREFHKLEKRFERAA